MSSVPSSTILTAKEAQQRLRCSRTTLTRWTQAGYLPFFRIGSRLFFAERDILRLLERSYHPSLSDDAEEG